VTAPYLSGSESWYPIPRRDDGLELGDISVQGVRTMDLSTSQWTTPDSYAGTARDPMTQRPYMWERNNLYSYADPSGFDTITQYSRDSQWLKGGPKFAHLFIEVVDDKGNVKKRYSFGPSDAQHPLGSKLILEPQSYDAEFSYGAHTWGQKQLASCRGVCTRDNGGFDEAGLETVANQISGKYTYLLVNSNSAGHTECSKNTDDLDKCDNPPTGGNSAPGYNYILDTNPDVPPDYASVDSLQNDDESFDDESNSNMQHALGK
jgi:hypothetical protein